MHYVTTSFYHLHRKRMRDADTSSNLRYADDTALIENSKEALEYFLRMSRKLESN